MAKLFGIFISFWLFQVAIDFLRNYLIADSPSAACVGSATIAADPLNHQEHVLALLLAPDPAHHQQHVLTLLLAADPAHHQQHALVLQLAFDAPNHKLDLLKEHHVDQLSVEWLLLFSPLEGGDCPPTTQRPLPNLTLSLTLIHIVCLLMIRW